MVKVVNIRDVDPTAHNFYIGRRSALCKSTGYEHLDLEDASVLANQFRISDEHSREEVINMYESMFNRSLDRAGFKHTLNSIERAARNHTVCLVCWCAPLPCHGDVIAKYINEKISGPVPEIEFENLFDDGTIEKKTIRLSGDK